MKEVIAELVADARELVGDGLAHRGRVPDDLGAPARWYCALRLGVAADGQPFAVRQVDGRLSAHVADGRAMELPDAEGLVQPLGPERWLVVRSRARREEHNARVYDAAGRLVTSFPVGDAVAHVETTLDARIWIGYFARPRGAASCWSRSTRARSNRCDRSRRAAKHSTPSPPSGAVPTCSSGTATASTGWTCAPCSGRGAGA